MTRELKRLLWGGGVLVVFSVPMLAEKIAKLIVWLLSTNLSESPLSLTGQIVCKVMTFVVSFEIVGVIFSWIGWFNSTIMKICYAVVSLVMSMVIAYVVMTFEQHMVVVLFILLLTAVLLLSLFIIQRLRHKW